MDNALLLVLRKAKLWDYEEEYRYLLGLNYCEKKEFSRSRSGLIYTQKLPEKVIKEVVLGCRIKKEDEDKILKIVSDSGMAGSVMIRRALIHNTDYKLKID